VTEPFIRLRNLRKVYRKDGREFPAISDATFTVAPGELACLVGPSGCGFRCRAAIRSLSEDL
jgi:NitT/TauT family transport system ATP-binding protein